MSRAELKAAAKAQAKRTARRRILAATVVAVAMVAAAVIVPAWLEGRGSGSSGDSEAPGVPEAGSSTLVAITDDDGLVAALALFAVADNQRVVLIHPSLLTTLPGFGENVISNAVRFGGESLLESSVTNLLGVRIDATIVVSSSELNRAVADAVVIDLPVPLVVADGSAELVVAGAGPVAREGAMVERLMTDVGLGDELDLLQRQGAVWEGLLGVVSSDDGVLAALAGSDRAAETTLIGVAAGDPLLTSVPSTRIEPSGDEERYQLDGADAAEFAAAQFPYLQLAAEPRVRVEVLNGNGLIGTTGPVATRLVEEGFRVVVTDNADRSDYPMTLIIAQGRTHQQDALEARAVLGLGEVSVEVRQPSGVVDLTIIVGQDLPAGG